MTNDDFERLEFSCAVALTLREPIPASVSYEAGRNRCFYTPAGSICGWQTESPSDSFWIVLADTVVAA